MSKKLNRIKGPYALHPKETPSSGIAITTKPLKAPLAVCQEALLQLSGMKRNRQPENIEATEYFFKLRV